MLTYNRYYQTIHPTYPILSQSSQRLRARLSTCPPSLNHAFNEALHAAVGTVSSPGHTDPTQQSVQRATQLVAQFENAGAPSASTDLVLLQTMMLLIVEAETHVTKGYSGRSRSVWLGGAVGLAYSLKLHLYKQPGEMAESDADSDDRLGRRIWWSLVIMDRWHASSTASPILIPEASVVVTHEDQALLGESSYQLARKFTHSDIRFETNDLGLSVVLGHFAEAAIVIARTGLPSLNVPLVQVVGNTLRGEMERWRESVPSTFFQPSNSPLVLICYWHLRIWMELRLAESEPSELLTAASNIVTQLSRNSSLVSPLTYHSTALAALVLIELTGHKSTREEAEKSLVVLSQNPIVHSAWDEVIRGLINKKLSSGGASALTDSQNLQQLAELATATGASRDSAASKEGEHPSTSPSKSSPQRYQELRKAIRTGYLSHILSIDSGL
jgi:hypothetical protein